MINKSEEKLEELDILGLPLDKALELIKNKSMDVSYIETRTNKNDLFSSDVSGDLDTVNYRVVKVEEVDNQIILTIVRK
ncbi:hypothetical protein [Natranaerofaba carboxydovora]|uniref:hypothetical protein n=1 Tax=Natranaerofaba carboxydovora TaxID=2742683 RepID=UPI001F14263B|nr:hypothetical protein [Natranaerofaba carboxydovora]UMZ73397.1 hypothetical protein ACONDI_00951 [Natranaerofaba carboxydovora]